MLVGLALVEREQAELGAELQLALAHMLELAPHKELGEKLEKVVRIVVGKFG